MKITLFFSKLIINLSNEYSFNMIFSLQWFFCYISQKSFIIEGNNPKKLVIFQLILEIRKFFQCKQQFFTG